MDELWIVALCDTRKKRSMQLARLEAVDSADARGQMATDYEGYADPLTVTELQALIDVGTAEAGVAFEKRLETLGIQIIAVPEQLLLSDDGESIFEEDLFEEDPIADETTEKPN